MPFQKIDRKVKMEAVILDSKGLATQDEVATIMKMGKRTLQRAKQKFKEHGDVEGGAKKRGRPPTIHHSVRMVCILLSSLHQNVPFLTLKALLTMVFEEPDALLKEYAWAIERAFHQTITTQRIGQILKEEDITRKMVVSAL
jgi:transposase